MRSRPTRQDRAMRPYFGERITWRSVAVGYGLILLVLAIVWAINHPLLAATVFAVIGGTRLVIRQRHARLSLTEMARDLRS